MATINSLDYTHECAKRLNYDWKVRKNKFDCMVILRKSDNGEYYLMAWKDFDFDRSWEHREDLLEDLGPSGLIRDFTKENKKWTDTTNAWMQLFNSTDWTTLEKKIFITGIRPMGRGLKNRKVDFIFRGVEFCMTEETLRKNHFGSEIDAFEDRKPGSS